MTVADALPRYHHRERHSVHVKASPEAALAAARTIELADVPLFGVLLRLRGLHPARDRPLWAALQAGRFQAYDSDTLVLVGRPWTRDGGTRRVEDFAAFDEPGYAKMAVDLRAFADGAEARLETETRILLTDASARGRFRAYWLVMRPFSGLTRRLWLRAAKRRAER